MLNEVICYNKLMNTKKIIITSLIALFFSGNVALAASATQQNLGKILIQTESYNRAWYVYPKDQKKYYFKDGAMAYDLIKSQTRLVYQAGLDRISSTDPKKTNLPTFQKFKGYFLKTEAGSSVFWYVNPNDKLRYKVTDAASAAKLMSDLGSKIKNSELKNIAMNGSQIAFDQIFNDAAYVKYDGKTFSHSYYADKILPLASLTKLMTALVLLDQKINWDKKITITADEINYPKTVVGDDATSEISCAAGDQMTFRDLWTAMLLASSNQAAVTLVDSTGISREQFVNLMNEKAKSLGLKKTIFYDVTGLNADNVTTPKEMAKIAFAAFSNPKVAENSVINGYTISALDSSHNAKTISIANRNYSLMKNFQPSAAKVGFLVEAQRTVAIQKDGNIIVVMHALSMNQRNKIITTLLK